MRPDNFGELRSLVHGPIGEEAWGAILEGARAWRGPIAEDVLIPYLVHHLDLRWNDTLRVTPRAWSKLALRGQSWPAMQLCCTLDLTRTHANPDRLSALAGCKHLNHITQIDLSENSFDPACADALLQVPCMRQVRRLSFHSIGLFAITFSGIKRLGVRLAHDAEASARIVIETPRATLPLGEYIDYMNGR